VSPLTWTDSSNNALLLRCVWCCFGSNARKADHIGQVSVFA
jgi:hypothetical protein